MRGFGGVGRKGKGRGRGGKKGGRGLTFDLGGWWVLRVGRCGLAWRGRPLLEVRWLVNRF